MRAKESRPEGVPGRRSSQLKTIANNHNTPSANILHGATSWEGVPVADLHPVIRYNGGQAVINRRLIQIEAAERGVPVPTVVAEHNAEFTRAAAEKQRRQEMEATAAAEETMGTSGSSSGRSKPRSDDAREEAKALEDFRHRLRSREFPPEKKEPLVADLIDAGTVFFIAGESGHGKSHIIADLACSVAIGRDFIGREVTMGPVVVLVGEGEHAFRERIDAWQVARLGGEIVPYEQLMLLPGAEDLREPDSPTARAMVAAVAEVRPSLVLMDTLNKYAAGADENSAKDMSAFLKVAEAIQRGPSSPTVGLVHHLSRAGRDMRGSTVLRASADSVFLSEQGKAGVFTLSATKQRAREEGKVADFTLEQVEWTASSGDEDTTIKSVVAAWELERRDNPNAVPSAREFEYQGMNRPKIDLPKALFTVIAATGGDGLTEDKAMRQVREYRTPKPTEWECDRAFSRLSKRKNAVLEPVKGTRRFRALPSSVFMQDENVAAAVAEHRAFLDGVSLAAEPPEDAEDADE